MNYLRIKAKSGVVNDEIGVSLQFGQLIYSHEATS